MGIDRTNWQPQKGTDYWQQVLVVYKSVLCLCESVAIQLVDDHQASSGGWKAKAFRYISASNRL
jgi:hypothetical protein